MQKQPLNRARSRSSGRRVGAVTNQTVAVAQVATRSASSNPSPRQHPPFALRVHVVPQQERRTERFNLMFVMLSGIIAVAAVVGGIISMDLVPRWNDLSPCTLCPNGTYCPLGRSTKSLADCLPAPAGYYTTSAVVSPLACPGGSSNSIAGSTACTLCASGLFSVSSGSSHCSPCLAGTWSAKGAIACTPCPAGTASIENGSSQCHPCLDGYYSVTQGSKECDACPAGTWSSRGAIACLPCPAGTSSSKQGTSQCHPCSASHYASATGSTSCLQCPRGIFSDVIGATSERSCTLQYVIVVDPGTTHAAYALALSDSQAHRKRVDTSTITAFTLGTTGPARTKAPCALFTRGLPNDDTPGSFVAGGNAAVRSFLGEDAAIKRSLYFPDFQSRLLRINSGLARVQVEDIVVGPYPAKSLAPDDVEIFIEKNGLFKGVDLFAMMLRRMAADLNDRLMAQDLRAVNSTSPFVSRAVIASSRLWNSEDKDALARHIRDATGLITVDFVKDTDAGLTGVINSDAFGAAGITLKQNSRIVLLDAGGEQAVATLVEIKNLKPVKTNIIATFHTYAGGGARVNEAFMDVMKECLPTGEFDKISGVHRQELSNMFERRKRQFYINSKWLKQYPISVALDDIIPFLRSSIEEQEALMQTVAQSASGGFWKSIFFGKDVVYEDRTLRFKADFLRYKLFGPAIDAVVEALQNFLMDSPIAVFAYGGFMESEALVEAIKERIAQTSKKNGASVTSPVLIVAHEPSLTVLRGAVQYVRDSSSST